MIWWQSLSAMGLYSFRGSSSASCRQAAGRGACAAASAPAAGGASSSCFRAAPFFSSGASAWPEAGGCGLAGSRAASGRCWSAAGGEGGAPDGTSASRPRATAASRSRSSGSPGHATVASTRAPGSAAPRLMLPTRWKMSTTTGPAPAPTPPRQLASCGQHLAGGPAAWPSAGRTAAKHSGGTAPPGAASSQSCRPRAMPAANRSLLAAATPQAARSQLTSLGGPFRSCRGAKGAGDGVRAAGGARLFA
mmetsp:Transcript_65336/g.210593  ORF Transcript_65336/g.210593 Transcript_65336/m.210593 type:complete len:249 (+) Transcript_65336:559-1305(+)